MCGLSGEIRFDGRPADVGAVEAMATVCDVRGPDGRGAWHDGPAALGHRRLAIIDLSQGGHQPRVDEEHGLAVVFDGSVHNHHELRAELRRAGHRFDSTSDSEVVLRGYVQWGADVVHHLVGMFAVVIHDVRSRVTVMFRDRLGIKPLYVSTTADRLRFASTLPALLAGGEVDTSIDLEALHHYLSWHAVVPAPRTILAGVKKLPPATVRTVEADGSVTDAPYWRAVHERSASRARWSARDWEDAVEQSLRTAVRRCLVADVPVGVLLSGGLDSSLIVGMLAEEGRSDLATYSIGFDAVAGRKGDEFAYSDVVAERYATDHHRIRVGSQEVLRALPHTIAAMSEPMVSHDVVAFDLLSEQVAQSVRVVQSGQGADEVFAGYHWYPPLAGVSREEAAATYRGAFFDRDGAGVSSLLRPDLRLALRDLGLVDASEDLVREHFAAPGAATAVDAALRLDTEVMLVDDPVKRVDNTTTAWGLEARVPFLDHDLVELAAACPPELKLADGGKGVLKAIGRRVIPPQVVDRPKGYFPVPALTHLEGEVLDLVGDALTSSAARRRGVFDPTVVARMLKDPNGSLTPLRGNPLWQTGLLELWFAEHGIDPGLGGAR